jgi:hypothetical protein
MTSIHAGSNLTNEVVTIPMERRHRRAAPSGEQTLTAIDTLIGIWRGHGDVILRLTASTVRADSLVFASASEFNTGFDRRFIGAARVQVLNVAPQDGMVLVWLSVQWSSDLNIAISLVVDP